MGLRSLELNWCLYENYASASEEEFDFDYLQKKNMYLDFRN